MATSRRTPAPPRRRASSRPAPAPPAHDDPAGLADVPPPLAYERTAAAAEDEGFDASTAAVFGAVVAVDVFCVAEANANGPGRGLDPLVRAADLAERALEAAGAGDAEFTHLFARASRSTSSSARGKGRRLRTSSSPGTAPTCRGRRSGP